MSILILTALRLATLVGYRIWHHNRYQAHAVPVRIDDKLPARSKRRHD